jgi:hypothetical protein
MPSQLSFILLALIPLSSGTVIAYWWWATRGTWVRYPAGRSLMGLLSIIFVGFGYGVTNRIFGDYPGRPIVAFVMYVLFVAAIIAIGFTIRAEMRAGKRHLKKKHPLHTGPLTVPVAEINEEKTDD